MKQKSIKYTFLISSIALIIIVILVGIFYISSSQNTLSLYNQSTLKNGNVTKYISASGKATPFFEEVFSGEVRGTPELLVKPNSEVKANQEVLKITNTSTYEEIIFKSIYNGPIVFPSAITSSTANVKSDMLLFTNYTFEKILIKVNISEYDISKVKKGDKSSVTINALPGNKYMGSVHSITNKGVESSGSVVFPVEILVNSLIYKDKIFENYSAQVKIILEEVKNVKVIQLNDVLFDGANPYVLYYNGKELQKIIIHLGLSDGKSAQILSMEKEDITTIYVPKEINEELSLPLQWIFGK